MTDRKAGTAGRAFHTIGPGWLTRLSQRLNGWRDGRRGIPDLPQLSGVHYDIAIPPHDRALLGRRDDATGGELEQLLDQSPDKCTAIVTCLQEILTEVRKRDAAVAALAKADQPLSGDELNERRHGERAIPTAGIAARRSREHQKTLAPKVAAVESANVAIDRHFVRLAELEEDLNNDVRAAQARAIRYCGHTERLRGYYWRALVRRHPDKSRLAGRVPPAVPAAEWITESNYRTVIGLRLPPGTETLTWASIVGGGIPPKRS